MGWSEEILPVPPLSRGVSSPLGNKPLRFIVSPLVVGSLAFSGIFGLTSTALADPHAIFYTAIGQQQLFFNVLAALDQADYVETQYDRQNLRDSRAATGLLRPFTQDQQTIVEQTRVGPEDISPSEPGVSALLSRLITLEGYDLYTDYLVRTLGADFQRRNAATELAEALCDFALGWEKCEPLDLEPESLDPERFEELVKKRLRAIVVRPQQYWAEAYTRGALAALASGTDQSIRDDIKSAPDKNKLPYAYSPDIHQWRNLIGGRPDKYAHEKLLDQMLTATARSFVPGLFDYPYQDFTVDATGDWQVSPYPDGEPADMRRIASALENADDAALEMKTIALAATERVAEQLEMTQAEGARADGELEWEPGAGNSEIGELTSLVEVPAAVREGELHDLTNILAQVDTSQEFSALRGVDEPGGTELVERGTVRGVQTTATAPSTGDSQGEVAGVLDLFRLITNYYFDVSRSRTAPDANIVAGHLEERATHVLDAITNLEFSKNRGKTSPTCGGACGFFNFFSGLIGLSGGGG